MLNEMRKHLGDAASAALPLLWAEKGSRGESNADVGRALEVDDAMAAKLLFGDRRAGRDLALKCLEVYGIPIAEWSKPLPKGWKLPHVAKAAA